MKWITVWAPPFVGVVIWVTVVSYAITALSTVEPTLRHIGQGA